MDHLESMYKLQFLCVRRQALLSRSPSKSHAISVHGTFSALAKAKVGAFEDAHASCAIVCARPCHAAGTALLDQGNGKWPLGTPYGANRKASDGVSHMSC